MQEKYCKLVIGGSRNFTNFPFFSFYLQEYILEISKKNQCSIELVSGSARGVDDMAKIFAKDYDFKFTEFPVTSEEWRMIGRGAGMVRNKRMIKYGDCVVAFWDGKSKGTKNLIHLAKEYSKPLYIIYITKKNIDLFFGFNKGGI